MGKNLYIIALASLLALVKGQDDSWCNIDSCDPDGHTLCKYAFDKPSDYCGDVEADYLTQEEIDEILSTHNEWRAYVASGQETRGLNNGQPAATNLGPLEWDDELAAIAQTWADQCRIDQHDDCRNVGRFAVGQNIAYKGHTASYDAFSWANVMSQWYDEVDKFDGANVKSVPEDQYDETSHYTQLMWADTKKVGCGGIKFNNDGKFKMRFIVCNYGPTGNYVNGRMYATA